MEHDDSCGELLGLDDASNGVRYRIFHGDRWHADGVHKHWHHVCCGDHICHVRDWRELQGCGNHVCHERHGVRFLLHGRRGLRDVRLFCRSGKLFRILIPEIVEQKFYFLFHQYYDIYFISQIPF